MKQLTSALALAMALTATAAMAEEPLKLGVIAPQTGVASVSAKHMQSGIELAIAHLGGKIGGLPIEVRWGDSQAKAEVAKQLADEMIQSTKDQFIIGPLFTAELLAMIGPVSRSETFVIGPSAGPGPIAGAGCSANFFNTSSQNDAQAEAMGDYLEKHGFKNAYAMTTNNQAGKDMVTGFKRYYKSPLADEVYTRFGQVDFAAELSALRAKKPDATFIFYPGDMGVQFVKQYGQSGLFKTAPLFTVWTVDQSSLPAIGDEAIGVKSAAVWSVDLPNPTNQRFVKDFAEKNGFLPNDYAAHSYDSVMLIDAAVKSVGGKLDDKPALRHALETVSFPSTRGDFKFNNNHFPIENFILREVVKDEKGTLVTKTTATIFEHQQDSYHQDCALK